MAFGFGGASNAMMGASAGGVGGLTQGNDLEVIQTEVIQLPFSCTACLVADLPLTGSRIPVHRR
jgi:hypothetical protein